MSKVFINSSEALLYDVDKLVYVGGDLQYNGDYGALVYDLNKNELRTLPFQG